MGTHTGWFVLRRNEGVLRGGCRWRTDSVIRYGQEDSAHLLSFSTQRRSGWTAGCQLCSATATVWVGAFCLDLEGRVSGKEGCREAEVRGFSEDFQSGTDAHAFAGLFGNQTNSTASVQTIECAGKNIRKLFSARHAVRSHGREPIPETSAVHPFLFVSSGRAAELGVARRVPSRSSNPPRKDRLHLDLQPTLFSSLDRMVAEMSDRRPVDRRLS